MTTRAFILTVFVFWLCSGTHGHFNLKSPMPYNAIDCNEPDCSGPCPLLWLTGLAKARNTPETPSAVWRRGQNVSVEWHRNNHEGGFYRRSLVPVKLMQSPFWHQNTAFNWGCFAQGMYKCGNSSECGTDKNQYAYRNMMHVPEVFPDGDYVFAMIWYGGIHWKRAKAKFSDYHTCAFVQIRGGPKKETYRPTFTPGVHHRPDVTPGKCATTAHFVGECGGAPCTKNPVVQTVPMPFRNSKPKVLRYRNILPQVPQQTGHVKIIFDDFVTPQERKKLRAQQKLLDDLHRAAEKADREIILSSPDPIVETPAPPLVTPSPVLNFTHPVLSASADIWSPSHTLLCLLQSATAWVHRITEHLSEFGLARDADALGL